MEFMAIWCALNVAAIFGVPVLYAVVHRGSRSSTIDASSGRTRFFRALGCGLVLLWALSLFTWILAPLFLPLLPIGLAVALFLGEPGSGSADEA